MINKYKRYQAGLTLNHIYKKIEGVCSCGCGRELLGRRRRWATNECAFNAYIKFSIIKGNTQIIRQLVYKRDRGICRFCNKFDEYWEADHIKEVFNGGGACTLENFQTLCLECHKSKTRELATSLKSLRINRQRVSFLR